MSITTSNELKVHFKSSMQKGYTFVRKGNVYITKNCRKLAHEAGQAIYIVEASERKHQSIRVPHRIYDQVLRLNAATKEKRAGSVRRKDLALESKVKCELLKLYPRTPEEEIRSILRHTLEKKSGRVGRNKDMPISRMVHLATRAYIRHKHTKYDVMLCEGLGKDAARVVVQEAVNKQSRDWAGKCSSAKSAMKKKPTVLPKN